MTISPSDIAQVKFSSTRFRAGYDQDEVDSFLDAVALSIQEMQADLLASRSRIAELAASASSPTDELLRRIVSLLEQMAGQHD